MDLFLTIVFGDGLEIEIAYTIDSGDYLFIEKCPDN